jgi:hypothetical protein
MTWSLQSSFAREHHVRGKQEGWKEGWKESWAEGRADSVVKVLHARDIEVPEDVRTRILACVDTARLDIWLERAVTATSVTDLFTPPKPMPRARPQIRIEISLTLEGLLP